ncbi:MAG: sugar phosphate isomerase/epimerase family protein, partial [Pseudomonadales bacterium]
MKLSRRKLIRYLSLAAGASTLGRLAVAEATPMFSISLAQWSLHRAFFGKSVAGGFRAMLDALMSDPDSVLQGEHHPLDFPVLARQQFGIDAVEYVNTFFYGHADDRTYLAELKRRADGEGVKSLLIMCDALGNTGDADTRQRQQAIDNHLPWLQAASFLGCRAIRVNARGQGSRDEVSSRVADSLHSLGTAAAPLGLYVLVENHGGLSSDGSWLAATIERADHPRVGTLPDFGNFRLNPGSEPEYYDRYLGVTELMPRARAVSAKSYDFDEQGNETTI